MHRDDGEEQHDRDRGAAAVVVRLMKNQRIIRSAITSVPFASALPITKTMSNTFSALMTM